MKRKFIRFKANIYSLQSEYLFASKRIKQVSHRSELADFSCEMNKNGREYFFLSEYFQKAPNIN
jgi:hypothetical protein